MNINLNTHKTIEALLKIKLPRLAIFLAFITSFNLWFLSIYFFYNDFLIVNGYLITLLTTLALTTSWCLIIGITVPKYFIYYEIISSPEDFENEGSITEEPKMNLFVFSEITLLHGFFIWLQLIFQCSFFLFLSIVFLSAAAQFLIVDILVKSAFSEYQKSKNIDEK